MNAANRRDSTKAGFTLVELLVVIVIIGILIALLVPVIASAVRTANDARVSAEIQLLAQSLSSFKDRYGEFPPSRIILAENGFYNTASTEPLASQTWHTTLPAYPGTFSPYDLNYGQLAQRSLKVLRKFFPQANFSSTGTTSTATFFHDFNGNDNLDANPILLEGPECLVFFLGGIPQPTGTGFGMAGFGKNPQNPFQAVSVTTNRSPSLFEFRAERLIDDDLDGIPGYIDSLATGNEGRYFAYFSSYGNGGYDPNDINGPEPNNNQIIDASNPAIGRFFRVGFGANGPSGATNVVFSPAPNPYTSSDAVPANGTAVYINPNSYQIISPGRDRLYGFGGRYNPSASGDRLPSDVGDPGTNPVRIEPASDPLIRRREVDNLSNFSNGSLE
jgi:general secretion pathway protein G